MPDTKVSHPFQGRSIYTTQILDPANKKKSEENVTVNSPVRIAANAVTGQLASTQITPSAIGNAEASNVGEQMKRVEGLVSELVGGS